MISSKPHPLDPRHFPNLGCYLEVIKDEKLVWTTALLPGFRPARALSSSGSDDTALAFTAVISLEDHPSGTKYTAVVIHGSEAARKRHEEMGFHQGWGRALAQLVALVKSIH